ncbi:DUF2779 domain-containing protein [Mesoplasma photuris]|uniref:DUF2779 domain-containing protein n=1 Tax=Mesoplasma photuris TaxID=217731 RepID=UPI00068C9DC1|nr:DUF2779 domain-containing protein [Mesoplasma photuris]
MKLKTPVKKEIFKLALVDCAKAAWIFNTKENFAKSVQWKAEHKFEYFLDAELNSNDEYSSDASSIDVYETYMNLNKDSEDYEKLAKEWEELWEDPMGFEISKFSGETIADGNEVGEKARKYFDEKLQYENNLKNIDWESINLVRHKNSNEAVVKTKEALTNQKIKYLYEPAFQYEDFKLLTRCDILEIKKDNHVALYEVKATSKVKIEHFYDVMYQVYILEKNGYIVDDIFICRIDSSYYKGEGNLPNNFSKISKLGTANYETYGKIDFEEAYDIVKTLSVPGKVLKNKDIELEKYFFLDAFSHGDDQNRMTLIEEYRRFQSTFDMDWIFENLSNILSLNDLEIEKYMNKFLCETPIVRKSIKAGWIYKTANESKTPYCSHVLPWFDKQEDTIFDFSKFDKVFKAEIYRELGIVYLDDLNSLEDPNLPRKKDGKSRFTYRHQRIFYGVKNKELINKDISKCIDSNNIDVLERVLSDYQKYPVYMYDFETIKHAVPRFEKSTPYQQIPFQYSIDVILNNEYDYNNESTMNHYQFIGEDIEDPRPQFLINFLKDMFRDGKGVYVAYNESFEKTVLKCLAVVYPQFEKPIFYIIQNTIDLMDFFAGSSKKETTDFLIYHPHFKGSYSIKKTQPALEPNFSYNDLVINKGDKASQTFREYVDGNIPEAAFKNRILPDMIKYCNRDTMAMVVILKKVEEIYKKYKEAYE